MANFIVKTWPVEFSVETPLQAAQKWAELTNWNMPVYEVTNADGEVFKVFILDTGNVVHKMGKFRVLKIQ